MTAITPDLAPAAQIAGPARTARLAGRAVSGLVLLFVAMDGAMKLAAVKPVTDTAAQLGWPTDAGTWRVLGAVLLGSGLLYAIPRTAVLGAILLTAYLGGAVATHARIGSPLASHTLFGIYIGVLLWLGLWLRSPALRTLLTPGLGPNNERI